MTCREGICEAGEAKKGREGGREGRWVRLGFDLST